MKPSLDVNSMKAFCIQHVEKIVLGGVVLLLLLFAVRAVATIRGEGPGFSPDELSSWAKDARDHWVGTEPGVYLTSKDIEIVPYSEKARGILDQIPGGPFVHDVIWNKPEFEQLRKREEPGVEPIKELRAEAGHGAMHVSAAAAAAGEGPAVLTQSTRGLRGRRWVVVTGLVPIKAQMAAYEAAFQDALMRDPRRDVPTYLGYRIERAEVSGDEDPDQLNWQPIKLMEALMRGTRFGTGSQEVVARQFIPQSARYPMVFPLPPLVNKTWGAEVAHYPEIPLLVDMPEAQRGMYPGYPGAPGETAPPGTTDGAPGVEAPSQPPLDEFAPPVRPGPGGEMPGQGMPFAAGGQYGTAMPGMPYGGYGSDEYEEAGGGGTYGMPGMYGPGMPGMYGPGMSGTYGYDVEGRAGLAMQVQEPIEYQLFRFFDFNVEPGKHYRYHVQAVLVNPNYKAPIQYLENPTLAESFYLEAEWSEPSEIVRVPYDSRLVVGPAKAPPSVLYEPSAQVVALTLRMEDGLEASQDYKVLRGHLANFEGTIEEKTTGPYGMPGGYEDSGSYEEESGAMPGDYETYPGAGSRTARRRASRAKKEEDEGEKIQHATGMLVLDIAGGDRLHRSERDLTEPGSLLLMAPDGSLIVRDELEDQADYLAYHVPEEEKRPKRPEGMYPGMEGEYDESMDMYEMGESYEEGGGRRRGRGRR